jgi:hypothetical protein
MDLRSKVDESAAAVSEVQGLGSNNLSEAGSQCDEDDLVARRPSDNCLVDLSQRLTCPVSEGTIVYL